MQINHSAKVLASITLGLGIGTLIINPRAKITDENVVVISCTTRQILVVNHKKPDKEEYEIPTGIYTTDRIVATLYDQIEDRMEQNLSGNMFAGLMSVFMKRIRPGIERSMNSAIESSCAFKDASFAPRDLTSQ